MVGQLQLSFSIKLFSYKILVFYWQNICTSQKSALSLKLIYNNISNKYVTSNTKPYYRQVTAHAIKKQCYRGIVAAALRLFIAQSIKYHLTSGHK